MNKLLKRIAVSEEIFLHIKKALGDNPVKYPTANDYLKYKLGLK